MKKLLCVVLLAVLAFAFTGCLPDESPDPLPPIVSSGEYELGSGQNVLLTVNMNDNEFVEVSGNSIRPTDYAFSQSKLEVKADYLESLAEGSYKFVLTAGTFKVDFEIKIKEKAKPEKYPPVIKSTDIVWWQDDLQIDVDLKGKQLVSVVIDDDTLPSERFTYNDGKLVLPQSYMQTLSMGDGHTITVTTQDGKASADFVVNDIPVISDKSDFVKLPGEVINNESFASLVTDTFGSGEIELTYALEEGQKGTLADNQNGTFNYRPADNRAGEIKIKVTATDSYGASADRVITLTYKTVNPKVSAQVYNSDLQDLVVSVNKKGDEKGNFDVSILSVSGCEITADNYSIDNENSTITIKKEFLANFDYGSYTFTVVTTAGQSDFTVEVRKDPVVTLKSQSNVVNPDGTIEYTVELNGGEFDKILIGETDAEADDFTFADGVLTIKASLVAKLTDGDNTLCVVTNCGKATVTVVKNDVPVIGDKTDFVKLPGEVIKNENFTKLVTNKIGEITVSYSLKEGCAGVLTDNANGTFNYNPETVFAGEVFVVVTAVDSYGLEASKEIKLTYKAVNPVIRDAFDKTVDLKDDFGDVIMSLGKVERYYDIVDILLDDTTIGDENYVLKYQGDQNKFSIKADYLKTLSPATYRFTVKTLAGQGEFEIKVLDTRPVTADKNYFEFVKSVTDSDVVAVLTVYHNVVDSTSFGIQSAELSQADFSYENNTLTIKKEFLQNLTPSQYIVTVNGVELLKINVREASAPEIAPESKVNNLQKADLANAQDQLVITANLYGKENETKLYVDGNEVESSVYTLSETSVSISKAYLATFSYGTITFKLSNSDGEDTFSIRLSDKPIANPSAKDGMTVKKYTNETISAEKLRAKAVGEWQLVGAKLVSVKFYSYQTDSTQQGEEGTVAQDGLTASGTFGAVTMNSDALTFDVGRADGWFGVVVFGFTVTDETGATSDAIEMEVVYMQRQPQIADAESKTYNKSLGDAGSADITYTITNADGNSDFELYKIFNGEYELVVGQDYVDGGKQGKTRLFTIKASYLNGLQEEDRIQLTVFTKGGMSNVVIAVVQTLSADKTDVSFDKNAPTAIQLNLQGKPLSVTQLKVGDNVVAAENYSFDEGVLTLSADFVASLTYGEHNVAVTNGYGECIVKLTISDSRIPVITQQEYAYKVGSGNLRVTIDVYDKTITALHCGEQTVATSGYGLSDGALVLYNDYLTSVGAGTANFRVEMSDGTTLTFTVQISLPVNPASVQMSSDGYRIDDCNDVTYDVSLNGNTFVGVSYDSYELDVEDYSFDTETGILTIKASFINGIYRFGQEEYAFILRYNSGEEQNDLAFILTTDHAENRVLNGGFETGNLYGWNAFDIWKNEAGMRAWTNDRVVDGGYFDQNYPYNRDGKYNLGIYGGGISKDSAQERMGHLRSSNFVLGGSGYVSFKLGGGKNSSFAYVSIRRTSDNLEVARFGNRHFNKTEIDGVKVCENGEAYMFEYYYDLSAYLGQSLYFVITDASSSNWCVLSADSFVTYYAQAPATTEDTLAVNILPAILGVDIADNSIKNGGLTENLEQWQDVNNVFKIDKCARSDNNGGDASTGVLRSSAFSVNGDNKYVRFGWAGGLAYDKQVFVSVKEVGTNIEVLRYVRRDNLSSKKGGSFDNHMLDLSGLDDTKLYYLEFADNTTGGWGLTMIKEVRLVGESEWNSVVSTDRAVSISGLETTFSYVNPY